MNTLEGAAGASARRSVLWRVKAIFGGSVGNLVEWFDWYVYSSFTLYFAKVFFPAGDATTQYLDSYAAFAAGFLVRPLGSWLMGIYADKSGRRAALAVSMLVMGLGSLVIAFVPGYAKIGLFAPLVLVLARLAQGLSVGGEYAASATYLSEVAGRKWRGFFGSFQYVTLIMGQLLALLTLKLLQQVLSPADLSDWGWRIPFVLGALLLFGALFVMLRLEETDSFEAVRREVKKINSWKLMRGHPRELAIVLGLTMGGSLGFYIFSTYIQQFLANTSGFSKEDATSIATIAMMVFMLVQPLFGWLADRIGRKPLLLGFGLLGTLGTVPLLTAIGATRNFETALSLVIVSLVVQSAYTSISGLYKAELFPTEIRALAVGLPYALGVSLVGGTGPLVGLALKRAGHETWFYWYVSAFMAIVFLTALAAPETKRHSRILED